MRTLKGLRGTESRIKFIKKAENNFLMKAFITGISGFVGKYLAEHLLRNGFEVYGIDRKGAEIKGCKTEVCDILDKEKLAAAVESAKPDAIFHLAALSSVSKSFEAAKETKKVNVEGTRNLLDAVAEAKISPVILVISSLQIYGKPDRLPIKEDARLRPASPYAESKAEQERLCREYSEMSETATRSAQGNRAVSEHAQNTPRARARDSFDKKKLKIIISRSFNHTGPGQSADFVWPSFAKQIAEIEAGKRKELNVGNLDVERDFSDVRDIARAYLLAVQKCKPGEIYNICSGKAYNIGKMLDVMKSFSTEKVKVAVDSARVRKEDVPVLYGDNTKFAKATGWKPKIPFEKTLKDILEYWRTKV